MDKTYYVYLLQNISNNRTYLGVTNNLKKCIRQHNGILRGGARYTRAFNGCWEYYLTIGNLTKCEALSIERTAGNKRRGSAGISPAEKRRNVLREIVPDYNDAYINLTQ